LVEFIISTKPIQQFIERLRKEISSEARSNKDREPSVPRLSETSSGDRLIPNCPFVKVSDAY
jgi:hypothetical protein